MQINELNGKQAAETQQILVVELQLVNWVQQGNSSSTNTFNFQKPYAAQLCHQWGNSDTKKSS